MATSYVVIAAAAVAIAAIAWAVPLVLADVFPYWMLRAQRTGRPPVKTESYHGRTAMIVGANGAFGSRIAKMFAHRDIETLVLVDLLDCTSLRKEIEAELQTAGKKKPTILVWQVDMMSYASCSEFAKKARELKTLDHVSITVGILSFKRRESPEGWETTLQVNYLSTALVALLLLPALKSSSTNPNPPVLTFTTSFGLYPAFPTLLFAPKTGYLKYLSNNWDGLAQAHQYGRSKALLLYFTRELASRVAKAQSHNSQMQPVTINSADPGPAWTALTAPNQAMLIPRLITDLGARDPQYCATALINGVSAPAESHGKIMIDFGTSLYPPYMERSSGRTTQWRVWEETREELEAKVPEVVKIYQMLETA